MWANLTEIQHLNRTRNCFLKKMERSASRCKPVKSLKWIWFLTEGEMKIRCGKAANANNCFERIRRIKKPNWLRLCWFFVNFLSVVVCFFFGAVWFRFDFSGAFGNAGLNRTLIRSKRKWNPAQRLPSSVRVKAESTRLVTELFLKK